MFPPLFLFPCLSTGVSEMMPFWFLSLWAYENWLLLIIISDLWWVHSSKAKMCPKYKSPFAIIADLGLNVQKYCLFTNCCGNQVTLALRWLLSLPSSVPVHSPAVHPFPPSSPLHRRVMSGGVCPAATEPLWSRSPEQCVGADMSLFCSQVVMLKSHRAHQRCDAAPTSTAVGYPSYYSRPGVQTLSHLSKYRH